MTGAECGYGRALYALSRDEGLAERILAELLVLDECFSRTPEFLRLLAGPGVSREEGCAIVDRCFCGVVHGYVLNVLRLLTKTGQILRFHRCAETFRELCYRENGILPAQAVTAEAMTAEQLGRLRETLGRLTGKDVRLTNRVDPAVLGGVRLDYGGRRMDGTAAHRLEEIRALLANTAL